MSIEAMKQALDALEEHGTHYARHEDDYIKAITALRQAIEQAEMVKKGTKAWADTPDNWVDDLRGGTEIVPGDHTNSHQQEPVAWIKNDELVYMSAVAGLGMTEWQTNLGLVHQLGDVPLYTTCPKNATTNGQEVAKSATTDWEAVAADQAMTIAMLKLEQKREWVGLTDHELQVLDFNDPERGKLARAVEAKLKEKNNAA
jgi:hypothetical protein